MAKCLRKKYMGVWRGDDAQVACHGQSIDDQENKEEWDLEVWTFWDSSENKFSDSGEISMSHGRVWRVICLSKKGEMVSFLKLYSLGLPVYGTGNDQDEISKNHASKLYQLLYFCWNLMCCWLHTLFKWQKKKKKLNKPLEITNIISIL